MSKLGIAAKELMKGNFGNAVSVMTMKDGNSELIQPGVWRGGNFFFGINGNDKAFIWGGYNSSLKAYRECPVVSSVINRKAECTINGKPYIMDDQGKESKSKVAQAAKALLKKPNPLQNGKQFRAQGSVYRQIYGWNLVLKIIPIGFENDYSKWRLWNIPPWMVQISDSTDLFFQQDAKLFSRIFLSYMGHGIELNPDVCFFFKENQISTGTYLYNGSQENVSLYLPDSKLMSLEGPVDNLISSLNSRGSLIRERGPLWILSNDSGDASDAGLFPIDPKTKDLLHQDFLQYGITRGQRKAIITDAKLRLQQCGFDVSELKLLEGEVHDAKMICDTLNYPPELLGLIDSKYDNQDIAERALYTNCILPDAESEDEQWCELLGLHQHELHVETDYKHVAALQENEEKKGKSRLLLNQAILIEFYNNSITWNRWRELVGEDTVPGMDKYYYQLVQEGWVFGALPKIDSNQAGDNNNSDPKK
jgi:hypothetical protein